MTTKAVALDTAAFLDSPEAAQLAQPDRAGIKRIAEIFLEVAYEELGKKPRLFDGQDVHGVLGHLMPAHFKPQDPLAEHVPAVLTAYFAYLETAAVVTQSFEIKRGLVETTDEFLETVRTGTNPHHHGHAQKDPFVHGAPKLGRNDPCACGSGKKYKKCHGKNS